MHTSCSHTLHRAIQYGLRSKTEAVLFSRKRKHWQARSEKTIQVGEQAVRFAREAMCWLGIWLDPALTLSENRHRCGGETRRDEARLRRIVSRHGVPPAAARNLQMAIVQGTVLRVSEPTWSGRKGVEGEYQAAIN